MASDCVSTVGVDVEGRRIEEAEGSAQRGGVGGGAGDDACGRGQKREIARRLGISRNTVDKLIDAREPPRCSRAPAGSMPDPLEGVLRRLLEEWPEIKAPRVTAILREDCGYVGSIHGTADPRFPIEHGEALAHEIPGARLLPLEGAGHGVDRADWDTIAGADLAHTAESGSSAT